MANSKAGFSLLWINVYLSRRHATFVINFFAYKSKNVKSISSMNTYNTYASIYPLYIYSFLTTPFPTPLYSTIAKPKKIYRQFKICFIHYYYIWNGVYKPYYTPSLAPASELFMIKYRKWVQDASMKPQHPPDLFESIFVWLMWSRIAKVKTENILFLSVHRVLPIYTPISMYSKALHTDSSSVYILKWYTHLLFTACKNIDFV